MLLRLAYLTVTNTFAVLRLLPMSDRDKDAEILALRHQIGVLQHEMTDDPQHRLRLHLSKKIGTGPSPDVQTSVSIDLGKVVHHLRSHSCVRRREPGGVAMLYEGDRARSGGGEIPPGRSIVGTTGAVVISVGTVVHGADWWLHGRRLGGQARSTTSHSKCAGNNTN